MAKGANVQLSTAPLAGVWRVEDSEERQLLGNARAADLVNRAQPTNSASGVSCTA